MLWATRVAAPPKKAAQRLTEHDCGAFRSLPLHLTYALHEQTRICVILKDCIPNPARLRLVADFGDVNASG